MRRIELKTLGGDVVVRLEDGYVRAWHSRSARDADEIGDVVRALEQALAASSMRLLLFDSRDAEPSGGEVQALLWRWLQSAKIERVATLMTSELLRESLHMSGLARGVKIRAFDDEAEAVAWLTA